jgi:enamine deaminase RidA (YjgF/YER057c/UK114 family)
LSIIEDALLQVASLAAVARTVTHVTDIGDAELVARAHRETFAAVRPVATLVEASRLTDPREKLEIEVYAVEPG